MSFRFSGLVPAFALLAAGAAQAQPASTGGGGSMAYPDSMPSGQVRTAAPTARDTGSMAMPAPSGGITTHPATRRRPARVAAPAAAPAAAAPNAAPTAEGRAAAASMADQPSAAPVPYIDFTPAPVAMPHGMRHVAPIHHAVMRHTAHPAAPAAATPAAATPAATPAPATPAK